MEEVEIEHEELFELTCSSEGGDDFESEHYTRSLSSRTKTILNTEEMNMKKPRNFRSRAKMR